MPPHAPRRDTLRVFAAYAPAVAITMGGTYFPTNWLAGQWPHRFRLYAEWELAIPLVPEMIWVYGSLYVMALAPLFWLEADALRLLGQRLILGILIAGAGFLLLPAELGYARVPPPGDYATVFRLLHAVDLRHNTVPSLHVIGSALIALAIMRVARWPWTVAFGLWLGLISVAVLLVHQHHVLDVAAAYAVVALLHRALKAPIRLAGRRCRRSGPRA